MLVRVRDPGGGAPEDEPCLAERKRSGREPTREPLAGCPLHDQKDRFVVDHDVVQTNEVRVLQALRPCGALHELPTLPLVDEEPRVDDAQRDLDPDLLVVAAKQETGGPLRGHGADLITSGESISDAGPGQGSAPRRPVAAGASLGFVERPDLDQRRAHDAAITSCAMRSPRFTTNGFVAVVDEQDLHLAAIVGSRWCPGC